MSRLFWSGGANYVGVSNLGAAVSWYKEKLSLWEIEADIDDSEGCVALGFSDNEYILALGPMGKPTDELRPILYTTIIKKASEYVSSNGVVTGPIQQDAQGTHYFEIRDLDGNVTEVCEEP